MEIMREKNVSCMVITAEEVPQGIFTERDIVRCMVRPGFDLANSTIGQVMSREVRTVTPETMLYEAFSVLTQNLIRHLVVVDHENKGLGVITQSDLLDHFEYDYVEQGYTVGQIMSRGIVTVDPYDSVYRAAKVMAEGSLSFLTVCRQLQPLGVITERDLAGFAAAGMDLATVLTQDVMSTPVHTIDVEQPAYKAVEMMNEFDIRHLVVMSGAGKALGVLTQTDMIRGLERRFIETLRVVAREQSGELTEARRLLAENSLRLDAILNSAITVGIAFADHQLRVTHLTPYAEFILGVTEQEVLGRDIRTLVEHRSIPYGRFEQALARIQSGDTYTFTMQRRENNRTRILQATLSGMAGENGLAGLMLILDDVTEKRLAEESAHRTAFYDSLTGLANRAMLSDRLKAELARCRRNHASFSLVLLDVDNFQGVNADRGHEAGDRLLREVGQRLDRLLRESDTVARLGSDEFCVLLVSTENTGDARAVAKKIVRQLSAAYDLNGTPLTVTFSLGVAMFPIHGEDEETLFRNAGMAMNQAKTLGKANGESNIVLA
jgi:diguanylate cyclase (GGDEF)-like protein/PAS domain S-box-containing protein